MLIRRDVLKFAVGSLAVHTGNVLTAQTALAQANGAPAGGAPGGPVPAAPASFNHASVVEEARALAKKSFKAPSNDLPEPFNALNYESYVGIVRKPKTSLWMGDNLGFAIEPLHRGFLFSAPVDINIVDGGNVSRLVYSPADYDFGALKVPQDMRDIGFSGMRILQTSNGNAPTDVALFQGASFFRAVARGQAFGDMARGLTIRTADPRGEEFPVFRTLWIERPSLGNDALIVHALLDSESATGAYQFTIRPGDATIIDTELVLFPRVTIDHFGVGAMTGMSLLGPMDRRKLDDLRPGVYETEGLQIANGGGEWLWRPASNRDTLEVSAFVDENPRGFGFLQRNRDFTRFQDDEQHWELRPSLWIEPIGDWGAGSVVLVEIPNESEINKNIIAYWRPNAPLAAGTEAQFAYRQFWCWNPPSKPPLAVVTQSRSGRPPGAPANTRKRRYLVEFSGDNLGDAQRTPDISQKLTCSVGSINNIRNYLSRDHKTYRVTFDLDPGNDTLCELRLELQSQGKPISEAWLYRWTQ